MQPLLTGWISLWEDLCFCKNKKTAAGLSAVSGEHGIEKITMLLLKEALVIKENLQITF